MELEVGLKITHTRDDLTSTTNLQVRKESSGPLFVSKEIDTMFILEGHLKGVRRENIDIDINKYGNRITISGKKPVQEMVLMGWIMHKKEAVMRVFEKSFRIPDGVKLDRIKAKFNDETSVLTIRMPKQVKGISGVGIEEVEEEEVDRARPEPTETVVDKVPERESPKEVPQESKQPTTLEKTDQIETTQPKLQKVVVDEIPEESRNLEAPEGETLEQKDGRMEDSSRVVEQSIDQGQAEAAKIPERVDSKETVKEKPEENQEEIETQTGKIPEDSAMEEGLKEHVHALPESIQSTKSRDDQVSQESEIPSSSSTQVEEKHETCTEDQRLTKPEPYQETKADDQTIKDEVSAEDQTQAEETEETRETPTSVEIPSQQRIDELECQKVEKQKSLSEEAGQGTKPVRRKSKVCTPIVVAGSAILISIIVLVIHLIRAKKR